MQTKFISALLRKRLAARFVASILAVLVFSVYSSFASELAILRNGFSIRHERRRVIGPTTRLFLGVDDSNFMDVPTADITGYEKDLSLPPVVVPEAPSSAVKPVATPISSI